MRNYYYLEVKQYSCTIGDHEYEISEGKKLPKIYRYLKTALFEANSLIAYLETDLKYEIETPNEVHPECKDNCKFAVTLRNKRNKVRKEIRIYAMHINNLKV